MNDILQQLLQLGPGIAAGATGNGQGMAAFMEAYQRTTAQLDEQDRLKQRDSMAMEDRQRGITRQQTQDQQAATQQQQADALQRMQIPGQLAQVGGAAESHEDAQRLIETLMPDLMKAFGQETMAYGQPAVEMATRTITARQKRQVSEFVEQALKTSFVADNPESDPEIANLPAHVQQVIGKPTAKLSELQRFAELPVGKPVKPPSAEVSWQIREGLGPDGKPGVFRINPKTGETQPVDGIRPEPPRTPTTDPEIAELRKELLRLQVENAGKPKEPNQGQFTAGAYAGRMAQAEPILTKVAPAITGMSLLSFETQTNSWFAKPTFQSAEVQSYMQAARNFINAVLRRESGAVISPSEFEEARAQYLPVAGDDAQALAQKAANRQYVFQQMQRSAGPAYEPPIQPPGAGGGFITAKDEHGNIHHAPVGTALPKGWTLVRP